MNNNEQVKLNISLDKTQSIICESCSNDTFNQVLFLRKASKFLTGTTQDALMPIPTFACVKCDHVNKEFQPAIEAQQD